MQVQRANFVLYSGLTDKVKFARYANPAEDYYFNLWSYQVDSEHRKAVDEELEELGIEYNLPKDEKEANRLGFRFSSYEGTPVLARDFRT